VLVNVFFLGQPLPAQVARIEAPDGTPVTVSRVNRVALADAWAKKESVIASFSGDAGGVLPPDEPPPPPGEPWSSVTRKRRRAGAGSVLPAASVARASSSCSPAVRPDRVQGFEHGAHGAPSKLHSNVAPFSSAIRPKVTDDDVTA
jgi:hypothetical protein